jgi:hypothetical protein
VHNIVSMDHDGMDGMDGMDGIDGIAGMWSTSLPNRTY